MTSRLAKYSLDDHYVPVDNADLVRVFQPFVSKLVQKYNNVTMNFEELLQHVWEKLFTADVITKYHNSGTPQMPKRLAAIDAASYCHMTWAAWRKVHYFNVVGKRQDPLPSVPTPIEAAVHARDKGVCYGCQKDRSETKVKLFSVRDSDRARYKLIRENMRDRLDHPVNSLQFLRIVEVKPSQRTLGEHGLYRTVCCYCLPAWREAYGFKIERKTFGLIPTPLEGDPGTKEAWYAPEEVVEYYATREANPRVKKNLGVTLVLPKQAKCRFKLYLARSVHNIYANWCRTRSRRYKDIYLPPTLSGDAWENSLVHKGELQDTSVCTRQIIDRAVYRLSERVAKNGVTSEQIFELLHEGLNVREIADKLGFSRAALQVLRDTPLF